jgi:hypothetical protein
MPSIIRRAISAVILLLIVVLILGENASGDVEPNDTFQTSEQMYDGTFTGSVSDRGVTGDVDVYLVEVAAFKDIDITARKLSNGTGMVTIEGYYDTGSKMGTDGILLHLTRADQFKEDTWYNGEGEANSIYLKVYGNGTYEIEVQFSDRTSDEITEILNICCLGTFGSICGLIVLVFVIFLIIFIFLFWFTAKIMGRDSRKRRKGDITQAGREPRMVSKKSKKKKKSPSSLKACPHCGSELVFPRTPKFCPYCDRRISTEAPEPRDFSENGDFY